MGKGKEAGAGRACAGGPVSMSENKSVSRRRAAHAFDAGVACGGRSYFRGCARRHVLGDAAAQSGLAVRESLYANRQSLCKRAALTKAGGVYANR